MSPLVWFCRWSYVAGRDVVTNQAVHIQDSNVRLTIGSRLGSELGRTVESVIDKLLKSLRKSNPGVAYFDVYPIKNLREELGREGLAENIDCHAHSKALPVFGGTQTF